MAEQAIAEQVDELDASINAELEAPAEVVEENTEAIADPAPAQEEAPAELDGVQKRINKITADKYEEKRRADELQRRLDELSAQQVSKPAQTTEPTLEDYDFDDAKFQSALVDHRIEQRLAEQAKTQQQQAEQQRLNNMTQSFNAKVAELSETATDYQDVVAKIPELPAATLEAVMSMDEGAKIAYYLGKHLDVADEIASSNPIQAAIRLGEIRSQLANGKPIKKPSSAPDPVETLTSGGGVNKDIGEMSMEEIYNS